MSNVSAVTAYVESLTLDPKGEAIAAQAQLLAARLDGENVCRDCAGMFFHPPSGHHAAAISKQLTELLQALEPKVSDEPDDDWTAPAVAEVRHAKGRKPRQPRPAGGRGGPPVGDSADAVAAARRGRGAGGAS